MTTAIFNLSLPIKWFRCADDSLASGLDVLHIFFPNSGQKVIPKHPSVCWEAKLFEAPTSLQPYINLNDQSKAFNTMSHLYDCTVCMLLSSVICITFSLVLYYLLDTFHQKFSQIRPAHKKWYVIVNTMKAVVLTLTVLNFQFVPGMWRVVFGGEIPLLESKRTTAIYVMTDLVGLALVPKLPFSTFMHHIMTVIIGMGIWSTDISAQSWEGGLGVVKMSFMYGCFSCLPFAVNLFLGLRVVFHKNICMVLICYFALISYLISIGLNWSLHIYWLYHCIERMDLSPWLFIYGGILLHIVRDDIILVKYLWKFPSTPNKSEKEE